jgi:hypothetical protein
VPLAAYANEEGKSSANASHAAIVILIFIGILSPQNVLRSIQPQRVRNAKEKPHFELAMS